MRPVGERPHIRAAVERPENPDDEGLGRSLRERVRAEDEDPGDLRGRQLVRQEIDDEDPRRDEEGVSGGVERVAVVRGEVGGDFGGNLVELRV